MDVSTHAFSMQQALCVVNKWFGSKAANQQVGR